MELTIKKALKEAGKVLVENFGKLDAYEMKEDQSNIVTKADLEAEMAIIKTLEDKFPDHNIIGEETGYKNKNSNYTWIIDPLDGTTNFFAGLPWFGVLICVLKDNEPISAGAYLPTHDLLYFAEAGKGATRNDKSIAVSTETELKNMLVSYSLDYQKDISKTVRESKIIAELVNSVRNLRATNSLVDFCYTAEGRLGGSINQTTKIWDIAAPYLIIKEAGGVVSDINGEQIKFKVNEENYQDNFTIVASNKVLHPKIIELIK